jgi:glycosyltransferase involved in cell wall biosynthesis
MRIAYMLTSLGIAGAERQVVALAECMAARGHAVAILVLRPRAAAEWSTDIKVVYLNMHKNPVSALAALVRARRFLRAFRPDVVHSHTFYANIFARGLRAIGAAPCVVSTLHNVYEGARWRTYAYRLTDGLSCHTTAVSQAVALRSISVGAVPHSKCTVLTNGIDTREFSPQQNRRTTTRQAMHACEAFVWLAVGRIAPAKDYPNLLRAFEQVLTALPQTELWIAGEPSDPPAPLPGLLNTREDNARVHWLGLRRDIPSLLDAADAFVLSSAWEGMPLAVGEAMAMQKPVAATDVGGVKELTGDCASIVPPKDSDALAAAMLAVMRTRSDEVHAQGLAARARIETCFSIDAKADEIESLYICLLAHPS